MKWAYYNEIDPFAAQWLKNLIKGGLIPNGEVDERSIIDVKPDDVRGFAQAHFFAGIGGWAYAARLAGWPDERPIWTGSCPCQPFSVAGNQKGQEDERHLWPIFFNLIRACKPDVVMGEQVAAAVGKSWLDGVFSDLERIDYAAGAAIVPACAVNAPHRRDRLWFVAKSSSIRGHERPENRGVLQTLHSDEPINGDIDGSDTPRSVANPIVEGLEGRVSRRQNTERQTVERHVGCDSPTYWSNASWIGGADGKQRRFEPSIRLLAYGVPARVGKLRAYGNAIVPQVAAEIMKSYLDLDVDIACNIGNLTTSKQLERLQQ
jgi:DNA (cytosine-5)-methyltransferase 1